MSMAHIELYTTSNLNLRNYLLFLVRTNRGLPKYASISINICLGNRCNCRRAVSIIVEYDILKYDHFWRSDIKCQFCPKLIPRADNSDSPSLPVPRWARRGYATCWHSHMNLAPKKAFSVNLLVTVSSIVFWSPLISPSLKKALSL